MSLALKPLKQTEDKINLFSSVIYHISFSVFLTLLLLRNIVITLNIILFILGNIISKLLKNFIMMATERSTSITKSCLVLVEFLAMSYIKYIDYDFDDEKKKKVSSEQSPTIKTILNNISKKIQSPVKKDVKDVKDVKEVNGITFNPKNPKNPKNLKIQNPSIPLPPLSIPNSTPPSNSPLNPPISPVAPVISPEVLKKSEAARKASAPSTTNKKPSEAFPALSVFSELALRKAEKAQSSLEKRYAPLIPSSLGKNNSIDRKSIDFYPSKRHSTPVSEKPKRTISMKLINSTAANRSVKKSKKRRDEEDSDDEEEVVKRSKATPPKQKRVAKPELREKNLNLFDERPKLSQPPRTIHVNKSPEINLQAARRYLKLVIKVRKHRNTI